MKKNRGKVSQESLNQYKSTVVNVMEIQPDKDINLINFSNIENYLLRSKSQNDFNVKLAHLKKFFGFLSYKTSIKFDLNKFDIRFSSSEIKKNKKRNPKPLKINEIIILRNLLKEDSKKIFTFEMVYQYGLTKKQLSQCTSKNFDIKNRLFTIKTNGKIKKIKVNDRIYSLINKEEKILSPLTEAAFDYHFEVMEEILKKTGVNRDISWQDINETRKYNFFRCSQCNQLYENSAENWVLVYDKDDVTNTKWIICKNCAMKGIHNG